MYPEWGIFSRERSTRSVADKSSLDNPENRIPSRLSVRRRGADPPKNESGTTGTVSSFDSKSRRVSSGNGTCIAAKASPHSELEVCANMTSLIRSLRPNAATMLSILDDGQYDTSIMIGNGGQISSIFFTDLPAVQ
jgi:hypothetical protein